MNPLILADGVEAEYIAAAERVDQAVSFLSELNFRIAKPERSSLASDNGPGTPTGRYIEGCHSQFTTVSTMEIAIFSGELHKWLSFSKHFEGLLHNNSTITANKK